MSANTHISQIPEIPCKTGHSGAKQGETNNDKNTIHLPRHSSFTIMQGFAKWGRVRQNMAESIGITTV